MICVDQTGHILQMIEDGELNRPKPLKHRRKFIIHKFTIPGVVDGITMAKEFAKTGPYDAGKYTGKQQGYHFFWNVERGMLYQCLPLDMCGSHASGINYESLAFAVGHDFEKHHMLEVEFEKMALAIDYAYSMVPEEMKILTHDEVRNPPKGCPGKNFDKAKVMSVLGLS